MNTALLTEEETYLEYFGFNQNPYPVAPDDENFYFSESIEQIIIEIIHGIIARKGFMILTGDIGLGKTTISRKILQILAEKNVETSLVFHTSCQDVELLKEINRDFGLQADDLNFNDQMWRLNNFLLEKNQAGKNCAIMIDDAQNLSTKSLELIRMISNLEADHQKLVQILLIGQPELLSKLESQELRQLNSRIIINKKVKPLSAEELETYLQFKLNASGNKGLVTIDHRAIKMVYQVTRGNFRQINILMDRCLYAAFTRNTKSIDRAIIKEASADIRLITPVKWKKPLLWIVSVALPVFFILGNFYLGIPQQLVNLKWDGQVSTKVAPTRRTSNPQTVSPKDGSGSPSDLPRLARLQSQDGMVDQKDELREPVTEFLKVYNLDRFAGSFIEALKYNRFEAIAESMFYQTGFRLIQLDYLPGFISDNFGALAYPLKPGGKDSFFLFWKPIIRFDKFYYQHSDQNIFWLQDMLARINLYHGRLDGIVGKYLMKAVIQFQKKMRLPITGYPDEKTIFLLYHFKENKHT
jgi:general secretion pathway protein A